MIGKHLSTLYAREGPRFHSYRFRGRRSGRRFWSSRKGSTAVRPLHALDQRLRTRAFDKATRRPEDLGPNAVTICRHAQ
jgi:hypothetical protein